MNKELLNEINVAYYQLELKQAEIIHIFLNEKFIYESGWYNGHYYKDDFDKWQRESYPIPVISLKGFCDIEIQFDKITVSTKLKKDIALAYSYKKLSEYDFEVYGVKDYLADFYHKGQTINKMKENISACDETEIGYSFVSPFDVAGRQIFEFVKMLKDEGFYY